MFLFLLHLLCSSPRQGITFFTERVVAKDRASSEGVKDSLLARTVWLGPVGRAEGEKGKGQEAKGERFASAHPWRIWTTPKDRLVVVI